MDFLSWYLYISIFILGAVIGSFLNVVIYRLHTNKSLGGRSHCLSCGKTLSAHELIPLISYVIQWARCTACGAHIPSRYFGVELLTALTFVFSWHLFAYDFGMLIFSFILMSVLIVIAIYDLRHTIIPDELTIITSVLAILYVCTLAYLEGNPFLVLIHVLSGLGAAAFFGSLWYFSKGKWMGFGDAKLAFPLGLIVGYPDVYSMVVLSFWIGAIVSLTILGIQYLLKRGQVRLSFLRSPLKIRSEVPFAPFLILGFISVAFLHANIFDITFTIFAF